MTPPHRGSGGAAQGRPPPTVDRRLLAANPLTAASTLLGALLVRTGLGDQPETIVGRIVEVEAYGGQEDRASHARMGPTARNAPMFGPPGHAYVYLVYGMHTCLNVVAGPEASASAVLIRAVEPLEGMAAMRHARALSRTPGQHVPDARLAAGPGLVGAAFGIGRDLNGVDLCRAGSTLRLASDDIACSPFDVLQGPRIGIAYAGEPAVSLPWRLGIAGSPSLSKPFPRPGDIP